jgi:hypothetical protein
MPYGPLPFDQALEKWRLGQEPQGQAAPYMPALSETDFGNPWADALAANEPPPGTATDATTAPHQGPVTSFANAVGELSNTMKPLTDPLEYATTKAIPSLYNRFMKGSSAAGAEEDAYKQPGIEGTLNRVGARALGGITNVVLGKKLESMDAKEAAGEADLEAKAERDKANRPQARERPPSFQEVQGGGSGIGGVGGVPQLSLPAETRKGFQMRGQGIVDQGAANEASARLEGEYAGKHATMYDQLMKEESELETRFKGMREGVEGSRDKAFQDYQAGVEDLAKMKIDPSRMYHDGGVPFVMTALAGAIAGGVAAGVNGGANPFLSELDKMLNRDINAQAANIQNKRAVNAEKQNLVQYWYGRLKDVDAAKLAAKQTSLEMFNQSLQKSLYDFKDKDSQNRIKSAMAITQQAGGENLIQYGNAISAINAANAGNQAAALAAQLKAAGESVFTPEAYNSMQNLAVFTPDGDGPAFMANSPEIAKKTNEKIANASGLRSLAAGIAQAYSEGGNNEDLVSKFTDFADKVRQASDSGALDEGTVKQRVDLFGKARGFDIPGVTAGWLANPARSVQLIQNYANSEYDQSIERARVITGGRPALFVTGIPVKGYGPAGAAGWIAAPIQSVGPRGREPTTFTRGDKTPPPKKKAQ